MAIIESHAIEPREYALVRAGGITPPPPSLHEALGALFKDGRRIVRAMTITFAAFLLAALLLPPRYAAHASLLVNFGPEYTVRPEAGQQTIVNQVADREQILATEREILQSRALQETVVRAVGLEKLYPSYAHPSVVGAALHRIRRSVTDALRFVQGLFTQVAARHADTDDPVRLAVEDQFAPNLRVEALKTGDVIELTFNHRDPELAALALNTLVSEYLAYRQRVYADVQAPKVMLRLQEVKRQLEEADRKLRTFKADNGISNFATQIDVLLHREGDLASDQQDADNVVKQLTRRLADVRSQLSNTPEQVTQYSDLDIETIQERLDQLRAREVEMRAHYLPDSAPLVEIRGQIAAGEAEIERLRGDRPPLTVRTGRNRTFDAVDLDRAKSEADLNAARARLERDNQQLADLRGQVGKLNASEVQLEQLERERAVADDTFRTLTKTYSERRLVEDVNARQVTTVRSVQQAEVPIRSSGLRWLLVVTGTMASLLVGAAVAIWLDYNRRGYLSPEAVERSLGLPVLATIPESAGLSVPMGREATAL